MVQDKRSLNLFNLIVVHEPGRFEYREALEILRSILGHVRVFDSPPPLILVKVDEPFKAVEMLRNNLDEESPILRIIPLDAVTQAYIDEVKETAISIALEKLREGETFAIRVEGNIYSRDAEGRITRLHKIDVIKAIAAGIDNPVNLDNPDKLILVKGIRVSWSLRYAGIMVAAPSAIYSKYARRTMLR